jgi:hypothetical protein
VNEDTRTTIIIRVVFVYKEILQSVIPHPSRLFQAIQYLVELDIVHVASYVCIR